MTLQQLASIFVMGLVAIFAGCTGSQNNGPMGTISGKLTNRGNTLKEGTIVVFMHSTQGTTGFGTTGPDGTFKIDSTENGLVPVGSYRVMIQPPDGTLDGDDEPSAEELLDNPALSRPKTGGDEFDFKYRQVSTSGLQYDVAEGENNFEIDLD